MPEFDSDYIERHLRTVHTHDSFSRAVVESVLREAAKKADGSTTLSVPVTFAVSRNAAAGCVQVCYNSPDGHPICIHQPE